MRKRTAVKPKPKPKPAPIVAKGPAKQLPAAPTAAPRAAPKLTNAEMGLLADITNPKEGDKQTPSGQTFVTLPGMKHRHAKTPEPSASRSALRAAAYAGENCDEMEARVSLSPAVQNAALARRFIQGGEQQDPAKMLDITACTQEMVDRLAALDSGDISEVKHLLLSQAVACQAIFYEMARRASLNMGTHLEATETYTRLALRAQSQSRATLETLAEIVKPRPVFINPKQVNHSTGSQQVNNAEGPQQINNGAQAPRACEKNETPANKLLGAE